MSKHFGGGRRLESNKEYPPPRRGVVEDKRPSVFDRLGVRKYEDNSSHYGSSGGGDSGSYRRNEGPSGLRKHSPMQSPMMGRRRSQDGRDKIRSRSRSRSFSPRTRKVPTELVHHHGHLAGHGTGHGQLRRTKMKELSPHHDHRVRRKSNSPMRRKLDKPGVGCSSPKWRDEGMPMSRQKVSGMNPGSGKKKGIGKRSGKKSAKEKKSGVKGRSSSGSSGTTGGTSSSSRSMSSSSSSSEASSSTTSNATSTSDSSVPSIKLKHDKQKRKKIKRPSSKSESVSTGQIQSRISSGSSIESGNVRDNRDLREKIKAKTRQNYERMQEGTPPDLRQQRRTQETYNNASSSNRNYNKPEVRDESPGVSRRRRPSGASSSFEEAKPMKRRRVVSPEEFIPSPRRAPPPNEPLSANHQQVRRDRTSPPRDRIRVIQSPMRRAPVEDNRRGDVRNDISKRLDNYGEKPRDIDRYRDDNTYPRDSLNRQKERVAPARVANLRHNINVSHQMTPDRERERVGADRAGNVNRFEARNRPLLQLPHLSPVSVEQPKSSFRGPEERVLRAAVQPQSPIQTKHSPMIVKSKEALIEKYRGMKQSQYVDMWVDKTVEACNTPASNLVSPPKETPPVAPARTFDESTETKAPGMKDIDELLSDFSDDADELLNDVGDEPKSEKSEISGEEKIKTVVAESELETASAGDAASPVEKKQIAPTVVPAPPAPTAPSVLSQDRKSVGTPQRSYLECGREGQSLPSRSQTEDDIYERMDFEEISDEELGDVAGENKIPIVDALGVDWASLVCGEKNRAVSPSSALSASSTSLMKVRKRWTPIQVISRVGLVSNCSETLLQTVVDMKMKEDPIPEGSLSVEDPLELEEKIQDELQNAGKLRKIRARGNVIDTIGLGPNSRALSSRRDMALRRYYLGMPQKSLVSMDVLHQNSSSSGVQDLESIGELYRLSLSLFKGADTAVVTV